MAALIFAWRPLIYRVTGAAAVVAVVVSLLLPNWYGATATCVPPQEGDSRGSLLRMFSRSGMDFGAAGLASATPMTDLAIGILKSRRLREQVVDRFDLQDVYGAETRDHAVEDLGEHVGVGSTAEGLIEMWVEDRDRQRAADMANAFVEFLDDYNRTSSVEQARRTREFIEEILGESRQRLDQAALDLARFQQTHKTVQLTEQTRVTVEVIAGLQSERTRLEIEKGLLEGFSTKNHVQMRQIEARLREIQKKLNELEGPAGGSGDAASARGGVLLPLSDIPALGFELADLTREVMVQEKVYEFLSSQLEEARIREARDLQTVTVLDVAVPPLKKCRPRRSLVCILTVLLAFAGSVGIALFAGGFLERAEANQLTDAVSDSRESRIVLRALRWLREWGGPRGERRAPTSPDS